MTASKSDQDRKIESACGRNGGNNTKEPKAQAGVKAAAGQAWEHRSGLTDSLSSFS